VVDVGCGTGAWLSVFREHGITDMLGLDGPYVSPAQLLIPLECFRARDLAKPFNVDGFFDLAISLEVAEHLPEASASTFVSALCRAAPVVLFSAAVPGQGGVNHLNEQWPEYWRRLFALQGYRMFDPIRSQIWHDERVSLWYRQNMFLFVHADLVEKSPRFEGLPEVKDPYGLMLVAPYIISVQSSLRTVVKRLPGQLYASAIWHLRTYWMRINQAKR
jgi:hypothetical protein